MLKLKCEEKRRLREIAEKILNNNKGILAADESPCSLAKKFEGLNIENTKENRYLFRENLFKTPDLGSKIGGVILHEETFEQKDNSGKLVIEFLKEQNIALGIKLDKGLINFGANNAEKVSTGLDGLDKRCKDPKFKDAEFAKWRSLFHITDYTPTFECIKSNCDVLAEYAKTCQINGIVPIIEPEILWNGNYSSEKAEEVYKKVLSYLFYSLSERNIYLPGLIVKTGFVTASDEYKQKQLSVGEAGKLTFTTFADTIPPRIPGVVFLSGGHNPTESIDLLKESVNNLPKNSNFLWKFTYSYGRALTDPFLVNWKGKEENVGKARIAFIEQIDRCYKAVEANK